MCNPSRSRGSAPAERDCGWTVFRTTCTGDGGTFLAVEKTERPPRPPGYNVEAKRGSFQMDSISHQRRCNFSPSTLDSGGAGGGALTPRCAKTPEHTAPSPEVVRNTVHLPTRCARSSLSAVHFRHNPWNNPSRIGSFQNPWRSPSRRATGTLGVALREGLLEKPWSRPSRRPTSPIGVGPREGRLEPFE